MNKITIIGCPGTGKTTYSVKLGKKLNIPVYHLDKVFWKNNWEHISQDEFGKVQDEIMQNEKWIIDGNFTKTIENRIKNSDAVIFFDYPKRISLWRTFKRYLMHFGKVRPDMGGYNKEKLQWGHVKFILNYPREEIYNTLSNYKDRSIFIFHNDSEAESFLANRL